MESQPQNPEFRNDPENFHPRYSTLPWYLISQCTYIDKQYEQCAQGSNCNITACMLVICAENVKTPES